MLVDCANQGIVQELGKTVSILRQRTGVSMVVVQVGRVRQNRHKFATSSLGRCGQLQEQIVS